MLPGPVERPVVWDRYRPITAKNTIILEHHYYGRDDIDRLPNPIVVAVYVNMKEPDLSVEAGASQEVVYIVHINKFRFSSQIVLPEILCRNNARYICRGLSITNPDQLSFISRNRVFDSR